MKKKISIDDLFVEESNTGFLCTIELVSNDSSKVKLTPWVDEVQGCSCESAIVINKDLIENVIITDDSHTCCGKRHKIVEAFFKDNASIAIKDVLQMAVKRISSGQSPHLHADSSPFSQFQQPNFKNHNRRLSDLQPCGSNSYNPDTQCCCYDQLSGQTFISTRQFSGQSDTCCCDPGSCVSGFNKPKSNLRNSPLDDSLCCGYYDVNGFPTSDWMSYSNCRAANGWALANSVCGH